MINAGDISTLEGYFLNVKEGVDDMIRFSANEPSVGLFYVQQHAQTSMPYLFNLKEKIGEKNDVINLHTEDIEDSISAVRSMAEFGIPITDNMIKDINKSLSIISTSQTKRGLINNPGWGFQVGGSTSNLLNTFNFSTASSPKSRRSQNYLSTVFNTAKQKAAEIGWPQPAATPKHTGGAVSSFIPTDNSNTPISTEGDELPVSSSVLVDDLDERGIRTESWDGREMSVFEDYARFRSEQESKLKEWLEENNASSSTK